MLIGCARVSKTVAAVSQSPGAADVGVQTTAWCCGLRCAAPGWGRRHETSGGDHDRAPGSTDLVPGTRPPTTSDLDDYTSGARELSPGAGLGARIAATGGPRPLNPRRCAPRRRIAAAPGPDVGAGPHRRCSSIVRPAPVSGASRTPRRSSPRPPDRQRGRGDHAVELTALQGDLTRLHAAAGE